MTRQSTLFFMKSIGSDSDSLNPLIAVFTQLTNVFFLLSIRLDLDFISIWLRYYLLH